VIESAADQRMTHVRTFQTGQNSALSQRILNEVTAAKICLLDRKKKAEYDVQLQTEPRALPVARPLPTKDVAPLILSNAGSPASTQRRTVRKKNFLQQPAVLAGGGVSVLLLAASVYWVVVAGREASVATTGKTSPPKPPVDAATAVGNPPKRPVEVAPKTTPSIRQHVKTPDAGQPDVGVIKQINVKRDAVAGDGQIVDVLKQIDVKRDAQWGEWRMEQGALLAPATANSRLQVPVVLPEEYKITLVAKGEPITRDIVFGLPIAGHQVLLALDGWTGTPSALQLVDGKPGTDNETTVNHRVLADGETEIVCAVGQGGIDVRCSGESVIHWIGNPSRLSSDRDVPDPKHIYLYSWSTPLRITRFVIEPLASDRVITSIDANGKPIDLVKQIDPKRDSVSGSWTVADGVLQSPSEEFSCLALPPPPTPEYRLTVHAERIEGIDTFAVGLPIGEHQVSALIDAWEGKFSGLETIDGKSCYDNESSRPGHLLEAGHAYTLVYTVRKGAIKVEVDGKTVIDWTGDPARLSAIPVFQAPDPTRLVVGTAHHSVFRLSSIEVESLGGSDSEEESIRR
jgi:hypothetical protein